MTLPDFPPLQAAGQAVRERLSGSLRAQADKIVRIFHWDRGFCTAVSSNAKSELPGTVLHKEKRLTDDQYGAFLTEMRAPKADPWEIAGRLANLTPEEKLSFQQALILKIAPSLGAAGSVTFTPGTPGTGAPAGVNGLRFLMAATAALPAPTLALLNPDLTPRNCIFVNEEAVKRLDPLPLDPEERGLLTVVRSNRLVADVFTSSFLGEARIRALLTAFWAAGLVRLESAAATAEKEHEQSLSPQQKALRAELKESWEKLESATYYEWFGLPPSATADQIRERGRILMEHVAAPSHEALFRGPEKELPQRLLAKLAEALEVLSDPLKRAEYDGQAAQGRKGSLRVESAAAHERDALAQAKASEKAGDLPGALRACESALGSAPESDRLAAAAASLILKLGGDRRPDQRDRALQLLKAAVQRKTAAAEVYESLGEWMSALQQGAKASEAFQRALSLNPFSHRAESALRTSDPSLPARLSVQVLAGRMKAMSFYDLLGLTREASAREIQGAYRDCTKRFHPDRFFQEKDAALKAQAHEIYKRMAEAYAVLKNPVKRKEYDARLSHAQVETEEPPRTPRGKKYYDLAMAALREGKPETVRLSLELAAQAEPECGLIRRKLEEFSKRSP